ncbi:MAG: hypothetical protein JSS66_06805 [Armatimonadetes bacterium]|nr:hypothetical protein [Armatimonadota bacterium]
MFFRKRITELEAQIETLKGLLEQTVADREQWIASAKDMAMKDVTAYCQGALRLQLQQEAASAVVKVAQTFQPCNHDKEVSTVIEVRLPTIFTRLEAMDGLFATDNEGHTTVVNTSAWSNRVDGKQSTWTVFARMCDICGALSPASWFDVAAAGNSLERRNLRGDGAIDEEPISVWKNKRTSKPLSLDDALDTA